MPPGPDGIPARMLKGFGRAITVPLEIMWRYFEEGVAPSCYKLSLVTLLHKKGDRVMTGNCRPVSLTSQIVKVFERVLKNILVDFLEVNALITGSQYGFRAARSTLSQLLAHISCATGLRVWTVIVSTCIGSQHGL